MSGENCLKYIFIERRGQGNSRGAGLTGCEKKKNQTEGRKEKKSTIFADFSGKKKGGKKGMMKL